MRLLFVTQKVDRNDAILGFVHGWLLELSKHFESIVVICLQKGDFDLPNNVRVLSLGKEGGISRFKYLINFYKYIWRERKNYNKVFVHMNPEYVVLGGLFWRLAGKKVVMWYNHIRGNWKVRLAMLLVNTLCHTSPHAFTAGTEKSVRMPAGIDTNLFKLNEAITRIAGSIMYIGRIAPIKKIGLLISAAKALDEQNVDFMLDIYGSASHKDVEYLSELKDVSLALQTKGKLFFRGAIANCSVPEIFNNHLISVNLTNKGSYDKTVLEGMACHTLPVVSNTSFSDLVSPKFRFKEGDLNDLVEKLKSALALPLAERVDYGRQSRATVLENHSLSLLALRVGKIFEI